MPGAKIKVVLVEDSALMRILISEIIRSDQELELLATATNGKDGVDAVYSLKPDVVITDMMMPEYDGLYVVRKVMEGPAVPVILLSSLERTDTQIFEGLQSGAFDFIDKPRNKSVTERDENYQLTSLVKTAARSGRLVQKEKRRNDNPHTFSQSLPYDVLVIGSSTGGPGAIEYLLDNLPRNLAIPVVIAQHMPERFIETFAARLNARGIFKVKVAARGETPLPGIVYLAPGTGNLRVVRDPETGNPVFQLTSVMYREFNFPSVDCLFESIASVYGERCIAIILTGMGKDGTDGLKRIHAKNGFTIAQDESSSVVYGMPKSALDAGVVKQVLKLAEIPGFIVGCLS